jgi:hypothetical protein
MVQVAIRCPQCSVDAIRTYVAKSDAEGLRLYCSVACSNCSFAEEVHGPELTDDARSAFYVAEGRWSLKLVDLGPRHVDVLHVLRGIYGYTPTEAMRVLREGTPVAEGALVEVERLEEMLREAGADLAKTRVS